MNRLINQSFGAVLYSPAQYMPATVQLHADQLHQQTVVQGLRDALYSAINQIKSLKQQNKSLEEKMNLQQTEWMQVEMKLKEELRQKDDLLKKSIRKRRARTKAHIDTLYLHAQKEREMERSEKEWTATFGGLVTTLQEPAQRAEDWSSQEQLKQEEEEAKIQHKEENNSQEEAKIQHEEENNNQEEAKIQHKEENKSQEEREEAKLQQEEENKSQEEWEEAKIKQEELEEEEEEKTKNQTEKKNNHFEKVKEEKKTTHNQQMSEKNKNNAKKNRG